VGASGLGKTSSLVSIYIHKKFYLGSQWGQTSD